MTESAPKSSVAATIAMNCSAAVTIIALLGDLSAQPTVIFNVLSYGLAPALDLGLTQEADDTLCALQAYVRDYPGLICPPSGGARD